MSICLVSHLYSDRQNATSRSVVYCMPNVARKHFLWARCVAGHCRAGAHASAPSQVLSSYVRSWTSVLTCDWCTMFQTSISFLLLLQKRILYSSSWTWNRGTKFWRDFKILTIIYRPPPQKLPLVPLPTVEVGRGQPHFHPYCSRLAFPIPIAEVSLTPSSMGWHFVPPAHPPEVFTCSCGFAYPVVTILLKMTQFAHNWNRLTDIWVAIQPNVCPHSAIKGLAVLVARSF